VSEFRKSMEAQGSGKE